MARSATRPSFLIRTADPRTDLFVSRDLHRYGSFDSEVLDAMKKTIHNAGGCATSDLPRRLVFDLGANMGFFGLYAASQGCDVIMVEMQSDLVRYVRTSALLNNWEVVLLTGSGSSKSPRDSDTRAPATHVKSFVPTIYLYQGALGNTDGKLVSFSPAVENLGGTSITSGGSQNTMMITLDSLIVSSGVQNATARAIFIKVDVEGSEKEVISGGAVSISGMQHAAIVIETRESTARHVLEEMRNFGYGVHDLVENGGRANQLFLKVKTH